MSLNKIFFTYKKEEAIPVKSKIPCINHVKISMLLIYTIFNLDESRPANLDQDRH